jgi:hypothetical protein
LAGVIDYLAIMPEKRPERKREAPDYLKNKHRETFRFCGAENGNNPAA